MTTSASVHSARTFHVRTLAVRVWSCALLFAASGCSLYTGGATTLQPTALKQEPGWVRVDGVPELRQAHELDCGPTALAMVLSYYGVADRQQVLAALPAEQRVSVSQLRDLARHYGFEAYVVEGKAEDLVFELQHGRPMIVGVAKPTVQDAVAHYEVVIGMNRESQRVATLDPAVGMRQNSFTGFLTEWQASGRVLLLIIPKQTLVTQRAGASPPDG